MKKNKNFVFIILLTFMALICCISSCSKDDDNEDRRMTVKNLTGVDWYDATIVFKESKDSDSKVIDMKKIGDVEVGSSFTTIKKGSYFWIDARNRRGKLFMSDILYSYDNVSVKSSDILINL